MIKRFICHSAFLVLIVANALAQDGKSLLEKTRIRGGLCLVIGARDPASAKALAAGSTLYVQTLQPDARLAGQWGTAFAATGCAEREKLGVRHAAFDPEHYGSDLFNLIVIEDTGALGKSGLKDLSRILVPGGCVAFRKAPGSLALDSKALGMTPETIEGYASVLRNPVRPFEWKPCDSLKWRAGMRAHMANGISGTTHGDGKYFYREFVEVKDGWPADTTQLVARDACNGRVLWIKQEDVPRSTWRTSAWTGTGWSMAADETGRLFVVTADQKLVCLDGTTGEQRFELISSKVQPTYVKTYMDKYVFYGGSVFSAEDGKPLWKYRGQYTTFYKDTILESDGATLWIKTLTDGKELLKKTLDWRADRTRQGLGIMHLGDRIMITEGDRWKRPYRVTSLDPTTGEKQWSHEFGGLFGLPARGPKGTPTFAGVPGYTRMDDKLIAYCVTPYFYVRGDDQKEVHFTSLDLATGKVDNNDYGNKARLFGNACATEGAVQFGDYLFYHHNVWLNIKTMERRFPYLVHPHCSLQPPGAYGMIYNAPGRKGASIQGISAIGPADIKFDQEPGGKLLQRLGPRPTFSESTKPDDWPTFRANNARGNAVNTNPGTTLTKAWEVRLGVGGRTYGQMSAERFGLTQPVIAYGIVYVSDIPAQRIVALDAATGKEKWIHHVGSRVDFPPTIYKGLCLFASKDGFVHCIDARTGAPVYRLLVASRERFIGGQEKLESLWPTAADVMIDKDGIGHASAGFTSIVHGGTREVSFKAETGEVVECKVNFEEFNEAGYPGPKSSAHMFTEPLAGGWQLSSRAIDDMLGYGNSISRTNEDRANEVFGDTGGGKHGASGRARGRVVAFDDKSCVAHFIPYGAASWANNKPMTLLASDKSPKTPLWQTEPIELVADDIVLTPSHVYVVGHYRRVKGESEIWVLSRQDGKVIRKTPIGGFPSFLGSSASGNRIFVSTREGKLICFEGK